MTRATPARSPAKARKKPGGAQPKRPRGRPPKYRPEFAERVTDLLSARCHQRRTGQGVRCRRRARSYRWLVTKPEFCQAVKDGPRARRHEGRPRALPQGHRALDTARRQDRHQDRDPARRHRDQVRAHRALRRALPARHRRRLHLAQEPSAPPLARQEGGPRDRRPHLPTARRVRAFPGCARPTSMRSDASSVLTTKSPRRQPRGARPAVRPMARGRAMAPRRTDNGGGDLPRLLLHPEGGPFLAPAAHRLA